MGDDNSFDRRTISDSTAKTILYIDNPQWNLQHYNFMYGKFELKERDKIQILKT